MNTEMLKICVEDELYKLGYDRQISRISFSFDSKRIIRIEKITLEILNECKEIMDVDELIEVNEEKNFLLNSLLPYLYEFYRLEKKTEADYGGFWEQFAKRYGWETFYANCGASGNYLEIIKEFKTENQSDCLVMLSPPHEVVSIFPLGNGYASKSDFFEKEGLFEVENYITILSDKGVEFNPFSEPDIKEVQEIYSKVMTVWNE